MFNWLLKILSIKNLKKKILFTFFIIFIFRIGSHIIVPGINIKELLKLKDLPFLNMINIVSGGAIQKFSIFSMGISPYITSTIIMQLLQMDIIPKFSEWYKQGEIGRRKLNQFTKYLTIFFSIFQSFSIIIGFNALSSIGIVKIPNFKNYLIISIILTTGTMFITWLGEMITENGIGNGISIIIFSGIVSNLPISIKEIFNEYFIKMNINKNFYFFIFLFLIIFLLLIMIIFIIFIQQSEYKIILQFTKCPLAISNINYLPLKINISGIMPVIFASSFITLPNIILQIFEKKLKNILFFSILKQVFNYNTLIGIIFYIILIVLFTFFYSFIQIDPEKLSENLQRQNSYLIGIRPGKNTKKYISNLLLKLSSIDSLFLSIITVFPIIIQLIFKLPSFIGLSGTSLLIIVSVILETVKQIKGLIFKKEYIGFIRINN